MKFSPLEWSPHVCTQPVKDGKVDEMKSDVDAEVVSVGSASISSSSSTSSINSSSSYSISSSNGYEEAFLEDPSVSFQALSLHQCSEVEERKPVVVSTPIKMNPTSSPTKRRIVKAIRISHPTQRERLRNQKLQKNQVHPLSPPQDISELSLSSFLSSKDGKSNGSEPVIALEARKEAFSSDLQSLASNFASSGSSLETFLEPVAEVASSILGAVPQLSGQSSLKQSPLTRSKRSRGGSGVLENVQGRCDEKNPQTTPSLGDRRKRRRLNRNQAMGAREFDSILSEIQATGSF